MSKPSVIAKLTARDGKRDEMIEAFRGFLADVENEAGTEVYTILTDDADDNAVWVFEVYTDKAGLDSHSNGEAMKKFIEAAGATFGGAPELHMVTPQVSKGIAI
jgi:quinol monooxygenase YgiN